MARKLATIQQITSIEPIPDADRIEKITIKGWTIVVGKGLYQLGDYCVYHEIDSFFLENHEPYHSDLVARGTKISKLDDGTLAKGFLIKTIKLKNTLSQGYCVPFNAYSASIQKELNKHLVNDYDVTKFLGVHKFEKPESNGQKAEAIPRPPKGKWNKLKWMAKRYLEAKFPKYFKVIRFKSAFPSFLKTTQCERIQNCMDNVYYLYDNDIPVEISTKLDGSSISVFKNEKDYGICSRNLRKNPKSKDDGFITNGNPLLNKIKEQGKTYPNYGFQGELISPKIQGNFEGVSVPSVNIFSVWDIGNSRYLSPDHAFGVVQELGFNYVPVLHSATTLRALFPDRDNLLQQLLKYADGPSSKGGKYREGITIKEMKDGYKAIKVISNRYLLKQQD